MKRSPRWTAATSLIVTLLLSACGGQLSDEQEINDPATVEHVKGSELARITLTDRAAERLDIRTATVEGKSGRRTVVPSDSLLVDPEGDFWVYTNPDPLVFVRHKIRIDNEVGHRAFLSAGPPIGTRVVTVGVAELYGVEYGIGH
jgi:hypothetical protein